MGSCHIVSQAAGRFADRAEAGRLLAEELGGGAAERVVLGVPRGGVVVAAGLAEALELEMDVLLAARIRPGCYPGATVGTVCECGRLVVDTSWPGFGWMTDECMCEQAECRSKALATAAERYRRGRARAKLAGRDVIIVDDGALTGTTMRTAVRAARTESPRSVAVALPVAPEDVAEALAREADEVVTLRAPRAVGTVGSFYGDYRPVGDETLAGIAGRKEGAG